MVTYSTKKAVKFIKDITYRFGVMNRIITDLGSTFTSDTFWDFCEKYGIEICYAYIAHPRANDQVERANALILEGICKRVEDTLTKAEGKWMKEVLLVIWELHT